MRMPKEREPLDYDSDPNAYGRAFDYNEGRADMLAYLDEKLKELEDVESLVRGVEKKYRGKAQSKFRAKAIREHILGVEG